MKPLRVFLAKLVGFVRRAQRERAFDEELESHLQLHIDDNVRAGMPPDEARRRALARLGGLTATRQAYHERGTLLLLEHTLQDARLAVRQLAQTPLLGGTAILVLSPRRSSPSSMPHSSSRSRMRIRTRSSESRRPRRRSRAPRSRTRTLPTGSG